ncbi:hypothetical protein EDC04DRAFT_2604946 [Pisolithus marmoratus]|nr:hypothetical protein EDC04DRAFT_2604946 [Pisolithus marmoratus]
MWCKKPVAGSKPVPGDSSKHDDEEVQLAQVQATNIRMQMPLDSVPPPSPHGKKLSDVGKHYHSFPRGTFKARFLPPIIPKFITRHFINNPPVWTWTVKDGPNKGKSFQVPTIPVTCDKSAHKVVQWIIAVFHSFKAHLNPVAIDTDTGRVLLGWLHLYQNNLYVHLWSQLKEAHLAGSKHAGPPNPPQKQPSAPTVRPSPSDIIIEELWAEIASLHEKLYNLATSHEACCLHSSNPPNPTSLGPIPKEGPSPTPSHSSPPTFTLLRSTCAGVVPNPSPLSWLTTALSSEDIPAAFMGVLYSPSSTTFSAPLPQGLIAAVKLTFKGSTPFYLGILPGGILEIAPSAGRSQLCFCGLSGSGWSSALEYSTVEDQYH